MGNKVTIPPLGNPLNSSFTTLLNNDLDQLGDEFDNVVYRDGSQSMTGDINMNSKRIYNLPQPILDHEPVRVTDVMSLVNDLTSGLATGMRVYATRTDMAASIALNNAVSVLVEGERKGLFSLQFSNFSTQVTADTQQGIYVPISGDPTGATGAWVRQVGDYIDPAWFGFSTANSRAANTTALSGMIATLLVRAKNSDGVYQGVERVRFGL